MANCTSVGQSGDSISLADNPLPSTFICNLSGYSQASYGQSAQVLDGNNNVVAEISSEGGGGIQPMTGSPSSFTATDSGQPYTVKITNTGPQTSRVIKTYDTLSAGSTTYAGFWMFISEDSPDGGDCDFNDSTVLLSWNLNAG